MTSLKKQTAYGVKWVVGISFLSKAIQVGTTIVLARMLTPCNFGLFALAFIAINGFALFTTMGFDSALIQRHDNVQRAANTLFFITPLIGILLCLFLNISAPLVGQFFNSKELVGITKILSILFVINAIGKVPRVLLTKNMQFSKVSIAEISGILIFSISAIILAVLGFGVWSLVIGSLLKTAIDTIMVWVFGQWRPKLEFDWKLALEMFHFGKFVFLGSVVWFLKMSFDKLLVGNLLGPMMLGLYYIAFNFANSGSEYFGSKVYRVLFPVYSKMQKNLGDLRSAFLKVLKYMAIIALPLGLGIFLLGGDFLRFAYGEKWVGAIPVLKILAWAGIFNTIPTSSGAIFLALGKPKLNFWITSLQVALFFIFIAPAAKLFGLNGVGIVVVAASFIAMIFYFFWVMKLLSLRLEQIYLSLKPALICSLAMSSVIIIIRNIPLFAQINIFPGFNFTLLFFSAVIVYGLSIFKIEKSIFREAKELVFS